MADPNPGSLSAGRRTVLDGDGDQTSKGMWMSDSTETLDLLSSLEGHRRFLRYTTRNLTDEQAAQRTTVSELCIGGLIKHVSQVERNWARFIVEGPSAMSFGSAASAASADAGSGDAGTDDAGTEAASWERGFQMTGGDTLAGLLEQYEKIAADTDELVRTIDLNEAHPLPAARWFPPGATWTNRRVLLHIIAETSQHSGHADIIREALDGSKTMG
jgi:Protein of unknown function (DUF664)